MYNSGKKGLDSNTLYQPGRYYVGAGSHFMEFPSTQKAIIFKSDNKQAFDTAGAYVRSGLIGLTNDGLTVNISMVVNYKLLDPENTNVTLGDQMVYIFNQLYGGSDEEEISDTISNIVEADTLQIISTYTSSQFYSTRDAIEVEIKKKVTESLKDSYITCTSTTLINLEFDGRFAKAIAEIMAEMQKIEQKQFELDAQQVLKQTAVDMANLNAQILNDNVGSLLIQAATAGAVYAARVGAQKTAEVTYNGVLNTIVTQVKADIDNTKASTLYKFFYLLVAS